MIPTLTSIRKAVDGIHQDATVHEAARRLPELRQRYRDLDALAAHEHRLDAWAEEEANRRRAPIRADIAELRAEQKNELAAIGDAYRELGVEPAGATLSDLDQAWPQASEIAAMRVRDNDILGDQR